MAPLGHGVDHPRSVVPEVPHQVEPALPGHRRRHVGRQLPAVAPDGVTLGAELGREELSSPERIAVEVLPRRARGQPEEQPESQL